MRIKMTPCMKTLEWWKLMDWIKNLSIPMYGLQLSTYFFKKIQNKTKILVPTLINRFTNPRFLLNLYVMVIPAELHSCLVSPAAWTWNPWWPGGRPWRYPFKIVGPRQEKMIIIIIIITTTQTNKQKRIV